MVMRMMCLCHVRTEMAHLRYMYETQVLLGTAHRARAREEGGSFCRALTARRISDVPPATVVRGCVPGREGDDALSKGWSICSTR